MTVHHADAKDRTNENNWLENFMGEEQPSLHIDTDWKKQAQEEKRKLAEQQARQKATPPPVAPLPGSAGGASAEPYAAAPAPGAARSAPRQLPPASFASLVQSIVTQVLFHLGDLSTRGAEPVINLDMAKHQIDTLGILEEKTKNNLSSEEKHLLDAALYETRMRYVSVASQFVI
jgi:hypothetical protein